VVREPLSAPPPLLKLITLPLGQPELSTGRERQVSLSGAQIMSLVFFSKRKVEAGAESLCFKDEVWLAEVFEGLREELKGTLELILIERSPRAQIGEDRPMRGLTREALELFVIRARLG
jgi:hypothetical protein